MNIELLEHYARLIEINKAIILQQSRVEAEKGSTSTIEIAVEKKRKKAEVIDWSEKIEKEFLQYQPNIESKSDPTDEDIVNIWEATQILLKEEKQPKPSLQLDDDKEALTIKKIDLEELKNEIRKHIKSDKIDFAFSLLEQHLQPNEQKEVDLLANRWTRLKKSKTFGTIRGEEYNVEYNQIIDGLYKIAEMLETEGSKK